VEKNKKNKTLHRSSGREQRKVVKEPFLDNCTKAGDLFEGQDPRSDGKRERLFLRKSESCGVVPVVEALGF